MVTYIYYLICPIDGKVRYVGKSSNPQRRYKQHITKLDRLLTPKRMWLESLFKKNLKPICKVVEKCDNDEQGRIREQFNVTLHKDTVLNIHSPEKGKKSFEGRYPKTKKIHELRKTDQKDEKDV